MVDKKMSYTLLFTLILAVFLCGAVSAASTTGTTTGKTLSAAQSKDITVTSIQASKATAKGKSITVVTTIQNQGTSTAKGIHVYLYLVQNKTLNGAHKYFGTQYVSSLAAGNSKTLKNSFIVPYSTKTGIYYVAAKYSSGHAFATTKTNVYIKKIDSGTSTVKTYGKFAWASYLTQNNNVASYTKFYNPNIKSDMNQFTLLGGKTNGFTNFIYIIPKLTGHDNYWTGFVSAYTPLQYYLGFFKPDMIKNGPNH